MVMVSGQDGCMHGWLLRRGERSRGQGSLSAGIQATLRDTKGRLHKFANCHTHFRQLPHPTTGSIQRAGPLPNMQCSGHHSLGLSDTTSPADRSTCPGSGGASPL